MKVNHEERPTVSKVEMHPFLKTATNPFLKKIDCINPFGRIMNSIDPKTHSDVEELEMINESLNQQKIVVDQDHLKIENPSTYSQHQIWSRKMIFVFQCPLMHQKTVRMTNVHSCVFIQAACQIC